MMNRLNRMLCSAVILSGMLGAAPAEAARQMTTPLLLIHGENDSQIPGEHAHRIQANANPASTEVWIVPDADHGLAHAFEGHQYELRVVQFFERHLCGPSPRITDEE